MWFVVKSCVRLCIPLGFVMLMPGIVAAIEASHLPAISELRLGVLAHDPVSPERGTADINGEILFKPLPNVPWMLRPHVGGTVNTSGKTSHVYAGLSWGMDLSERVFIEASLGGVLQNGKNGKKIPANRNAMGCVAQFRESVSLGIRLSQNWSVMGTVEHVSNAGLCHKNRGLTNFGLRAGYRF